MQAKKKKKQEHARESNKANFEQEKAMKRKGSGLQLKNHIYTPKPQIQDMEPRRERLTARTLPCDCAEKRRIKGVQMCLDMFGREIREKRRKDLSKKLPKSSSSFFFFGKMRGLEVFIAEI